MKKFELESLKVNSFVTLENEEVNEVKGGLDVQYSGRHCQMTMRYC